MPTVTENGLFATEDISSSYEKHVDVVEINGDQYYRAWMAPEFYEGYNYFGGIPAKFSMTGCWLKVSGVGNEHYDALYWDGPDYLMNEFPRLVFDDRVYIDGAPVATGFSSATPQLPRTGGYLEPITVEFEQVASAAGVTGTSGEMGQVVSRFAYPENVFESPVISKLTMLGVRPSPFNGGLKISNLYTTNRTWTNVTPSSIVGYLTGPGGAEYTSYARQVPEPGDVFSLRGNRWETKSDVEGQDQRFGFLGSDIKSFYFNGFGLEKTQGVGNWGDPYVSMLNGSALNILCLNGVYKADKFQQRKQ